MKTFTKNVVLVVLIVVLLAGCSWIQSNRGKLQLAIDIAVAAMVDKHPENIDVVGKAALILVQAGDLSQNIPLSQLKEMAIAEVEKATPNMTLTDKVLLRDLANELETSINGYFINEGVTDASKKLVVLKDVGNMMLAAIGEPAMQQHLQAAKLRKVGIHAY